MNIDTIILSGGGPSGLCYVGIIKALREKNILKKNLEGIKEIITTSVGLCFSLVLLLDLSDDVIENIINNINVNQLINFDEIDIDTLLFKGGLFDNKKLTNISESIIKNSININNITLKELYDKTKIKLTVKVFNLTLSRTEYISYETDPDISYSLLLQMTTAIPFFFKPVKYKNNLFVDGGLRGSLPLEICSSKNYLAFNIKGGTCKIDNVSIFKDIPILEIMYRMMHDNSSNNINFNINNNDKIFNYDINFGLNFNLSIEDKHEIINKGYNLTIEKLNNFKEIFS
jgi:NTE family protein